MFSAWSNGFWSCYSIGGLLRVQQKWGIGCQLPFRSHARVRWTIDLLSNLPNYFFSTFSLDGSLLHSLFNGLKFDTDNLKWISLASPLLLPLYLSFPPLSIHIHSCLPRLIGFFCILFSLNMCACTCFLLSLVVDRWQISRVWNTWK